MASSIKIQRAFGRSLGREQGMGVLPARAKGRKTPARPKLNRDKPSYSKGNLKKYL